jgi:acyl-CoA thioester hydrolase
VTPGPYAHTLRVRFQECDPQGVLYFSRYLDLVDVAFTELWRERLGPYGEMVDAGTDMVVAEVNVRYRAPARFDDEVRIELAVERVGTTSAVWACTMLREDVTLAEVSIRHVFIDPATKTKKPIPEAVRTLLEGAQAAAGTQPSG